MHTSTLAFESPAIASIASLVFGTLVVYAYLLHLRAWWVLFQALGWYGFTVYFGLLAISAGADPLLGRAEIVLTIRFVLLITYMAFAVWGVYWARGMLRHRLE